MVKKTTLSLPYTIICTNCSKVIAKHTKFYCNQRRSGETYLDIKIIEFSLSCPACSNVIRFKTNPEKASFDFYEGARVSEADLQKQQAQSKNFLVTDASLRQLNVQEEEEVKLQQTNIFIKKTVSEHKSLSDVAANMLKEIGLEESVSSPLVEYTIDSSIPWHLRSENQIYVQRFERCINVRNELLRQNRIKDVDMSDFRARVLRALN